MDRHYSRQVFARSRPSIGRAVSLIRLLRPRHWIKNAFVLAPLVFAGMVGSPEAVGRAFAATALFMAAASAVYIFNDLIDRRQDRLHPVKRRTRPLAAGTVTVTEALAVLSGLVVVLLIGSSLMPATGAVIGLYLAVNAAYSLRLKAIPVLDLVCVATGFVLRVWGGAVAIAVPLSSWMLITTLWLALYLAAIKRRQELTIQGTGSRTVLGAYSVRLLDRFAGASAVGAALFYSLYVIRVRPELLVSIPLVLFGILRYRHIVRVRSQGESPTDALYSDPLLITTVTVWAALSVWAVGVA